MIINQQKKTQNVRKKSSSKDYFQNFSKMVLGKIVWDFIFSFNSCNFIDTLGIFIIEANVGKTVLVLYKINIHKL